MFRFEKIITRLQADKKDLKLKLDVDPSRFSELEI